MDDWRKFVSLGLVFCLMHLSLADWALSAETTTPPNPTLTRQQVVQFGLGANVKLRLAHGKRLRGSIQAIEEGSFLIALGREGTQRRVAYDEVAQLKLAKVTYKASGQPDAAAARRVVAGLGVGKHIVAKTAAGQEYHGNIQAIAVSHFVMLPDHQSVPVQIAYNDMVQLGPNLSTGAKIAIAAGVVAVVVTILIIYAKEHFDYAPHF